MFTTKGIITAKCEKNNFIAGKILWLKFFLFSMHASVKIICFLNRNVSKYTTCSVNPHYGLLKRENLMAILLLNFLTVTLVISEGEGREPTLLCSLIYFSHQFCEVLFLLCLMRNWGTEINLIKVIHLIKQESLLISMSECQHHP